MANLATITVTTLVGQRHDFQLPRGGTIADLTRHLAEHLRVPAAEQLLVQTGRRLLPSQPVAALDESAGVYLVRRPSPERRISFSVRVSGARDVVRVEGVRRDSTVAAVRAAAAARLLETAVPLPPGGISLLLRGKLLDETAGLIAVEYGLEEGSLLLAVPARRGSSSNSSSSSSSSTSRRGVGISAQIKVLGVPVVRVDAISAWSVRELKESLQSQVGAHWQPGSALRRRCDALGADDVELHFRASDGHTSRELDDDELLPLPERGSIFFALPSVRSLDPGALRLLAGRAPPDEAAGDERDVCIREGLLQCCGAELARQRATETSQPDSKLVGGKRRQRSVKLAHSRRVECRTSRGMPSHRDSAVVRLCSTVSSP